MHIILPDSCQYTTCICGFMQHGLSLNIHLTFLSKSIFFDGVCQELNLSFGEITEEAALTVANAVKNKSHLKKLDLNGTNLVTLLFIHPFFHTVYSLSEYFSLQLVHLFLYKEKE